ncbi:unnamed protein product [Victoria cruziana]
MAGCSSASRIACREGEEEENAASGSLCLEMLPQALLQSVMARLDVSSLCSASAACKAFHASASQALSFIPSFHLMEIAPKPEMVRRLLPANPCMKSLKLDCGRLDDSSIVHLTKPSLQELCLQNCDMLSSRLLSEVGKNCGDLRSLSLGLLAEGLDSLIHCSDLEQLLRGCSKLESLSLLLSMSTFVGHNFSQVWASASEKLVVLEIGFILSGMVKELLSMNLDIQRPQKNARPVIFPNLQKLCLSVDIITDSLVSTISKGLVSLSHLDLRDAPMIEPIVSFDLTNFGIQHVNQNGKLKHLSLVRSQEYLPTYFKRVNDLGILLMSETCSGLESIHLGGFCRITDAGFRAILHSCSNLHKLKVWNGTQLTDLVFHDISATSLSLTSVSLRSCKLLTDLAITRLSSNKDLGILDLRGCREIGDDALKAISCLSKLKSLQLDGSYISDTGLSYIGHGAASLVSLSVRGCIRLTDKCVSSIFSGSLRRSLQVLDLSLLPNLSDDGILMLAKCGVLLAELRLRECPCIGDTSVMAMASMQVEGGRHGSSLRLLDLYNCGHITKLALRWFWKPYFPRLRWLGVIGSVNRDMVDALARSRPFLNVACHGEELGSCCWDSFSNLCGSEYEEIDELEQWLIEGDEDWEEDEEMEDELI